MINILYKGRVIYKNISDDEINNILLELSLDEKIDENDIEIEEI
jgi:(2Fe-2S) ferredoxin